MYLKIAYKNSIHLMNMKTLITYQQLQQFIKSVFSNLPTKLILTYKDKNQYIIYLTQDQDLKILFQSNIKTVKIEIQEYDPQQMQQNYMEEIESQQSTNQPNAEVFGRKSAQEKKQRVSSEKIGSPVQSKDENSSEQKLQPSPKVTHNNTNCSECQATPIIGIRYKCVFCKNYDLCEQCEAKSTHDHPFLKIKRLNQSPLKIFAIVDNDEEQFLETTDTSVQQQQIQKKTEEKKGFSKLFGAIKKYTFNR